MTGNKSICPKCKRPLEKGKINKINKKQKKVTKLVVKKGSAVPKKMTAQRNKTQRRITLQIGPHHIKNALARLQTRMFGSTVEEIANEIQKEIPGLSDSEVAIDVDRKMKCAIEVGIAELCGANKYRLRSFASVGIASSIDRTSLATEAGQFWECYNRMDSQEACRNRRPRSRDFDPFASSIEF